MTVLGRPMDGNFFTPIGTISTWPSRTAAKPISCPQSEVYFSPRVSPDGCAHLIHEPQQTLIALRSHRRRSGARFQVMTWIWRRKNSWFSDETFLKRTPIPNPGEVLTTSPFNRNLVSPNHNATSNLVSTRSGMGISTKQPPRLKSETLPPYHWLPHRAQFRRDGALHSGGLAPILVCKAKVVHHPGRYRKVPERLFRAQIEQSNLAVLRRSRLTRPLHPKVDLVLSIRRSDDFVHLDVGSNATQLRAVLTDIDRGHTLGEYLTSGVSPKNADRHLDWFSRFTTLSHLFKYPRLRMVMEPVRFIQPVSEISHRNATMSIFTVQIGKMTTLYFLQFSCEIVSGGAH